MQRRRLSPLELADAAVLGCVSLVICLLGWFIPHASALIMLATAPLAVIAYRHRARAVVAAAVAACAVGFLVAGTGLLSSIIGCGIVGVLAGAARRRRWRGFTLAGVLVALVPVVGAFIDGVLLLFPATRKLVLEQVTNTWKGVASLLDGYPPLRPLARWGTTAVHDAVAWWWLTVPVIAGWTVVFGTLAAWYFLPPLLERLDAVQPPPALSDGDGGTTTPDPLPVRLDDVGVRYRADGPEALAGITAAIEEGTFTALVGPNGSGKSTLARVVAGAAPTSGRVTRPGPAGVGEAGGTAVIFQRPESQVLGVTVGDDVVWGLARPEAVDVAGLLESVGLTGMEARDTSTLSGGELQRLAVAAALARRPALVVSDESTAMVDPEGRVAIGKLLAALPERGVTVVHATHNLGETDGADQVLALDHGRLVRHVSLGAAASPRPPAAPTARAAPAGEELRLEGVGHTWAARTPWANRALTDVNLRIQPGEGVALVGGNGSGKSTLAWVLAGLVEPTEGRCTLGGVRMGERVGTVGLAFQHARLQIQRPTVLADVQAAGGVGAAAAGAALRSVGLAPEVFGRRSVEALSGGQLRRVALAGLLAHDPAVLILDEPLAGLDAGSQVELLEVLARLRAERGTTLVMVTHDLAGVEVVCERLVELDRGRVVADRAVVESTS